VEKSGSDVKESIRPKRGGVFAYLPIGVLPEGFFETNISWGGGVICGEKNGSEARPSEGKSPVCPEKEEGEFFKRFTRETFDLINESFGEKSFMAY